jgi:hypothetical protein
MRNHSLLGKILATIAMGALDAGVLVLNPSGALANPGELDQLINGFMGVWSAAPQPAPSVSAQPPIPNPPEAPALHSNT